ncbi:MAG: hypothetical protein Q9195_007751, partial [Heterodermia aff. obscurata]
IYTPQITQQTRPLSISERGHWRVDMSSFAEETKARFWAFLEEIVGKGQVGWGVWCVLEEEGGGLEGEGEEEGKEGEGKEKGGKKLIAKILCWGEIVGEIWNVLFIGLHRQVVGTGVCWVDAEGKVVVRMK